MIYILLVQDGEINKKHTGHVSEGVECLCLFLCLCVRVCLFSIRDAGFW